MTRESIRNPQLAGDSFTWIEGPVGVLLFHGFTATTAEVRLLAGRLREAGYTVAGPLLPGHGTHPDELNQCRQYKKQVDSLESEVASLRPKTMEDDYTTTEATENVQN